MYYSEWYSEKGHQKELMKSSFCDMMDSRERLCKLLGEFYFQMTVDPNKTLEEILAQCYSLYHDIQLFLDDLKEYEDISGEKVLTRDYQDLVGDWMNKS